MSREVKRLLSILLLLFMALLIAVDVKLIIHLYQVLYCDSGTTEEETVILQTDTSLTVPLQTDAAETPGSVITCTVRADGIVCWSDEARSVVSASPAAGETVTLLQEKDGYCLIRTSDGSEVFLPAWGLKLTDSAAEAERQAAFLAEEESEVDFDAYSGFNPIFSVKAASLNCRSAPSDTADIVYTVPMGTNLTVLGYAAGYALCTPSCGGYFWCFDDYLIGEDDILTAAGAVDLRSYLPEAQFELLFASENNVTGHALYPAIPLLQEDTAVHLKQAYDTFLNDGYILKIYDAYRPLSAQIELYSVVRNGAYIANPYTEYSFHQYGRAVDISLVDSTTGEELEMPTPMHTFSEEAMRVYRSSSKWSETAYANVQYMTSVMKSAGFSTIVTEWWHFQYMEAGGRMDPNFDLSSIPAMSAEG